MSSQQAAQPPRPIAPTAQRASLATTANPMRPVNAAAAATNIKPAAVMQPPPTIAAASPQNPAAAASTLVRKPAPNAVVTAAATAPSVGASTAAPTGTFLVDNIPYRKFSQKTIESACNIALTKDKAIKLDYWVPSLDKKAIIALTKTGDRHLFISRNDFTTKFEKCYNVSGTEECIIETANSIYIVAKNMAVKNVDISQADLMGDDDEE